MRRAGGHRGLGQSEGSRGCGTEIVPSVGAGRHGELLGVIADGIIVCLDGRPGGDVKSRWIPSSVRDIDIFGSRRSWRCKVIRVAMPAVRVHFEVKLD